MLKKILRNKRNFTLNHLRSLRFKHKTVENALKDAESLVGNPGKYFNIRNELMSSFADISSRRRDEFADEFENPLFKGIL